MRTIKSLIAILMSVALFVACNKSDSASLTLDKTSLYFSAWGDASQSVRYVPKNAVRVAIGSCSDGWSAVVYESSRTIEISPVGVTPGNEDNLTNDDLPKKGWVVVNALNEENSAESYYINVYIAQTESLDAEGEKKANCYVVTKPAVSYTFDATHRPDGEALNTHKVKLLWQSNSEVVENVNFADGKASFYVGSSESDASRVEDTNAVIAAYNASGNIVWSWHLWITNENPLLATDIYSNGKTFMRQNLGAFTNSNGALDVQKIHDSYGMYYQWGRKDPFPRPYSHDAADGESEGLFSESVHVVSLQFEETSSAIGTVEYAIGSPLTYITNAACLEEGADGVGDWLAVADNTMWSGEQKSLYDPCPNGWRVPTAEEMSVLFLSDNEDSKPLESLRGQYGWYLSDGNGENFFYPACGRYRYTDGKIENMNSSDKYPSQPQPWEGYYWTSTTEGGKAVSLYFDLTTTRTINKFQSFHSARKANGFQVRCVKE